MRLRDSSRRHRLELQQMVPSLSNKERRPETEGWRTEGRRMEGMTGSDRRVTGSEPEMIGNDRY